VTRAAISKAFQQIDAQPIAPERKVFAKSILQQELTALNAPPPVSKATPAAASVAPSKTAGALAKVPVPSATSDGFDIPTGDDGVLHVKKQGPGVKSGTDDRATRLFMAWKNNQEEFKKRFIQNLPKLMFVLMPLIALFLKLFYIGSKRYLTEHFVFTLHFHAMVFVVLLLVMLAQSLSHHFIWATALKSAGTFAFWYMLIYLFLALRFFYKQGWFMTSLKFFMLFISYSIAFGLTFAAGVVLTAAEIAGPAS
jgi:hypothetical protein